MAAGFQSPQLARYVARLYFGYFCTLLFGVVCVYLVADFGDRLKLFWDRSWVEVSTLYVHKAVLAVYQLTPAAMLLAAAATVSTVRQRGEYTALLSLGGTPRLVFVTVTACALLLAGALTAFDEWVVRVASARIDQIQVARFNSWGDWWVFNRPKQWFRKGDWVLYVRGEANPAGLVDVVLWRLDDDFDVAERIDAQAMHFDADGRWKLEQANVRRFALGGALATEVKPVSEVVLPGTRADSFQIRGGRPEQMSSAELLTQMARRSDAGLTTARWAVAFHSRFAYPLTGVAAALLAMVLATRRARKGHLTLALVEGVAVAAIVWSVSLTCRALALASLLTPWLAAWAPVIFVGALAWAWYQARERFA